MSVTKNLGHQDRNNQQIHMTWQNHAKMGHRNIPSGSVTRSHLVALGQITCFRSHMNDTLLDPSLLGQVHFRKKVIPKMSSMGERRVTGINKQTNKKEQMGNEGKKTEKANT